MTQAAWCHWKSHLVRWAAGARDRVPSEATIESVVGCSATQVAEMQESLQTALDGDTGGISPFRVLNLYFECLSIDFQVGNL